VRNFDSPAFDFSLPTRAAQFRSDLRLIREQLRNLVGARVANFLVVRGSRFVLGAAELLFISTVIQIALALPMAWYFHRATTMALPANALMIPIAEVLLPAAVLAVALSYVSSWMAYAPTVISSYALGALTGTVRVIGHMRISDVRVPTPTLAVCGAAAAALGLALLLARRRLLLAGFGLAALVASAAWIVLFPPKPQWHPGVFEVTAIDVGQGDSLLLITPEGKTLLLDAGGVTQNSRSEFDAGEEVVSPYLWSRGIRRLDAVAISHAHTDHLGGMRSVIANFQPREMWYGVESPSPQFRELLEAAKMFHVEHLALTAGDTFDYGGAHFRVLNPELEMPPTIRPRTTSRSSCTRSMARPLRCWSAMRTSASRSCFCVKLRRPTCSRWDITVAPPPARRSSWPRSSRDMQWFRLAFTTPSDIRGRT
jgi:competence protein ComEC